MKKLLLILLFLSVACPAWAVSYIQSGYLPDSGKQWATGSYDLSIANNLVYAGWNAGMSEDEIADIFYYGLGGNYYKSALSWWFSGEALYNDPGAGGGYYQDVDYADFYLNSNFKTSNDIVADIGVWLRAGHAVDICLDGPTAGNKITAYGIEYDADGYQGLWVINHNDQLGDDLWLMEMHQEYRSGYNTDVWVVDGGWYDGWVLNTANGLMQNAAPVPEPGTALLLSLGLLCYRNRRSRL